MKRLLLSLGAIAAALAFIFFGPAHNVQGPEITLGADTVLPFGGVTYTLAGSGVSASATSITLTSLTIPQTGYEILDSDLSNTFYITLEPGNRSRQEFVSCTTVVQNSGPTATLSGCSRGLLPVQPYTASSTYAFAHGGGTAMVFSNPPQFYNDFAAKANDESITGIWSFNEPTTASSTATKNYVDTGVLAGCAAGSTTVKGCVEIATTAESILGTATGGTGSTLVAPNSLISPTSTSATILPLTGATGKLSQAFQDLTAGWTFSGGLTSSATTTLSGASTIISGVASSSVLVSGGSSAISGVAPGTSGNVLQSNGSSWISQGGAAPQFSAYSNTTTGVSVANASSTVVKSLTLPTLGIDDALVCTAAGGNSGGVSASRWDIQLGSTSLAFVTSSQPVYFEVRINDLHSTSSQIITTQVVDGAASGTFKQNFSTSTVNMAGSNNLNLTMYQLLGSNSTYYGFGMNCYTIKAN